jgi:hypothetical protein
MASWGTKRRNFIISVFLSIIFIIVAITGYVFFYEAPTCFDGKQNGTEAGVDCGGECQLLCTNQALPPLVKWTRYFEVIPGLYNAVAYLENQNTSAGTQNLEYKFTIYDRDSTVLSERTGSIELRPKEIIPVVANELRTGVLKPARISFEITNEVEWQKAEIRNPIIIPKDQRVTQPDGVPRVTAVLENIGFNRVEDIRTVVILYNEEGNAIGVSSTKTNSISPAESENVIFTWPQNFVGEVSRVEIIPLYDTPNENN